ncbi:Shikimate kinase [Corynebacterium camporealensis]|uniref:Shikimate kinase n=1 Tax=Corynebacterium camporealensis TaxID=161896 RepID=A0A0F6TAR4_9CORY|nr:shikimate kinase [Corynebacterium camporealensis]AKE39256.1 shikimate kinase [Corynebacterium camporealensis]AVH88440.1 Shikimate kinase [Corynebacterium camporealensis]MDY5840069.1 shikimate kinase [Corynebacterium camporealensis]
MTNPCPPTGQPSPRAVLVGPPGAGKSTIGRRLSNALNLPLIDTDELIADTVGKPCGEYFAEVGEPKFRELEEEIVAAALENDGIISLGGGAVLSDATRDLLDRHTVIFIDVSVEEGVRRTSGDDSRPVLQAEDPEAHYRALLDKRRPLYDEVADFRARTDNRSPQQIVGAILSFLDTL